MAYREGVDLFEFEEGGSAGEEERCAFLDDVEVWVLVGGECSGDWGVCEGLGG